MQNVVDLCLKYGSRPQVMLAQKKKRTYEKGFAFLFKFVLIHFFFHFGTRMEGVDIVLLFLSKDANIFHNEPMNKENALLSEY